MQQFSLRMTEAAAFRPHRASVTSQADYQGYFDVTEYDERDGGYIATITQYRKCNVALNLSPAAFSRYYARQHIIGANVNIPYPEYDYFATNEERRKISNQMFSQNYTQIVCKYCSGPHLTQSCPVKQILTKETKKSSKMYLCKFEPIPVGFYVRDMLKLIDDYFGRVHAIVEKLNELFKQRELTAEESQKRVYYANVLRGLPPKLNIREDRYIQGKRPGQRIDTGISGYEICFATFRTREAADFAEKHFQRVELIGQNTFMYCMFLREVDG